MLAGLGFEEVLAGRPPGRKGARALVLLSELGRSLLHEQVVEDFYWYLLHSTAAPDGVRAKATGVAVPTVTFSTVGACPAGAATGPEKVSAFNPV